MQYWLYAFKWGAGNLLIGQYETFEEANLERDRLDHEEYEYADILEMEYGQEPKLVSSENFEIYKGRTLVKWRNKNER